MWKNLGGYKKQAGVTRSRLRRAAGCCILPKVEGSCLSAARNSRVLGVKTSSNRVLLRMRCSCNHATVAIGCGVSYVQETAGYSEQVDIWNSPGQQVVESNSESQAPVWL